MKTSIPYTSLLIQFQFNQAKFREREKKLYCCFFFFLHFNLLRYVLMYCFPLIRNEKVKKMFQYQLKKNPKNTTLSVHLQNLLKNCRNSSKFDIPMTSHFPYLVKALQLKVAGLN